MPEQPENKQTDEQRLTALKAKAYDLIGIRDSAQRQLQETNQQIGLLERARQIKKKPEADGKGGSS